MKHFFLGAALAFATLATTAAHASSIKLEAIGTVSDVSLFNFLTIDVPLVPDPIVASGANVQLSLMYDLNSLSPTEIVINDAFEYASYRADFMATATFSNASGSASFDLAGSGRIILDGQFGRVDLSVNDLDASASAFGGDDRSIGLSFVFGGLDLSSFSIVPNLETLQAAVTGASPSLTSAEFRFFVNEFDANGAFTGAESASANIELSSITVSEVPLPAAGWMLIAGVGGLAAMRRRAKAA